MMFFVCLLLALIKFLWLFGQIYSKPIFSFFYDLFFFLLSQSCIYSTVFVLLWFSHQKHKQINRIRIINRTISDWFHLLWPIHSSISKNSPTSGRRCETQRISHANFNVCTQRTLNYNWMNEESERIDSIVWRVYVASSCARISFIHIQIQSSRSVFWACVVRCMFISEWV